jgi:hypothetical protein
MSNFWDIVWLILSTFVFVAYLLVLFQVVTDLFRDTSLGGIFKVVWIIGLIFLPFLTAFLYIITRGEGMAARQQAALQRAKAETDTYIRQVAAKSPAEQIADAKALLDESQGKGARVITSTTDGVPLLPRACAHAFGARACFAGYEVLRLPESGRRL